MYKDIDGRKDCHRTKTGRDGKAAEADEKRTNRSKRWER